MTQHRPTHPSPHRPRPPRRLWLLIVCALVALGLGGDPAWAGRLAAPARQTVPLVPPPTWTPAAPATPIPTRPRPTEPSPGATPVPQAQPWLWLTVEPSVAAPGMTVTARLEVRNIGASTMPDALATLEIVDIPPWLTVVSSDVTAGAVVLGDQRLQWRLGAFGAGAVAYWELSALIALDAPPDRALELVAEFGAPPTLLQDRVTVSLPWALLPEAGGD